MTQLHPQFNKIKEALDGAASVIVIGHQNPDGDAIGSMIGMGHYLTHAGINHRLFCMTPVPAYLTFLPETERMVFDERELLESTHDVVIVLDSGDLRYAGVHEHIPRMTGTPVVINIDHHHTNTNFGHINVVNPQASSTAEIIFHFLDYFRLPLSKETATALLTGILTDTGSFSNLGTTPSSMDVSSKLLAAGARVKDIIRHTFQTKSLEQLQLWGRALSRLKKNEATGIVTTILTKKDFEELGVEESSEGIANFLNSVEKAKAIMVLYEKGDGLVKGSLRTTQDGVDVSKIAKYFGGGGHPKAAGFTIKGTLKETENGWEVVATKEQPS
ncbi:MAG: bifunctional oligoribonuclease/PAP phosphatase NrnA [Candidatus Kerfeldbacteria bacterium]|nr:bifunctional oligoribonuclease/PAP phosphatase NrnA [Candidatus Kerfeldbacteria bacterium]